MEYDRSFCDLPSPRPLKPKPQHHHHCFISCFRPSTSGDEGPPDSPHGDRRGAQPLLFSRCHEVPQFRSKCLGGGGRHRRYHSSEFRYDPLSYARNFDEGALGSAVADDLQYRCFSSRLPASPPRDGAGEKGLLKRTQRSEKGKKASSP